MQSGAFVGFQGTQQLYIAMLDRRLPQVSSRAACAGACGLTGLYRRAKVITDHFQLLRDPNPFLTICALLVPHSFREQFIPIDACCTASGYCSYSRS